MKANFLRSALAASLVTAFLCATGYAATIATDKASDPAYSGGWTNNSNGGTGWGAAPWGPGWGLFVGATQTDTPNAFLVASSTSNDSNGDVNADHDIDTAGVAWGMVSNGATLGAARFFNGALVDGQKFVINMDDGAFPPGGTEVGFKLQSSDAEDRLSILLTSGSPTYQINAAGFLDTGITNTDQGLHIVFQQVNVNTGHVFITTLGDGNTYSFSNILLNTAVVTRDVAAVSLVNLTGAGGATNRLFFNSMSILPNPADTTLFADLAIADSVSPNPGIVGSNVTYTLTVSNNGPSSATGVTFTDTPPAGITFAVTPSQGSCTTIAGQVICDLSSLASGAVASVTMVGAPSSTGFLNNSAVTTALNVDTNAANNLVADSVNVVTGAGLAVTPANHDFTTILTGTTVQTTFVVSNTGSVLLTGSVSVATAQFAVASGSPFSVSGGSTANVAIDFTPDSVASFTDNVIFASNGGDSTNQVTGIGAALPVPAFTGTPTVGPAALFVTFSNTSTGTITNQFWNFGDGGTSGSLNPSHNYTNAGAFSVSLTVFGPLGSSNLTRSSYITVTNILPQLTVTPSSRSFGTQAVSSTSTQTFSVINSGLTNLIGTATASPAQFAVVAGGSYTLGASQTGTVSVTFTPGSAGSFTGSVVFASNGGASTNQVTGTGAVAPSAVFSGAPTSGVVSLAVTFTNASTGTITNQLWNFGDSGTSSSAASTLVHSYTNAGTFSVSLTVFGPLGSSTTNRPNYIVVTNVAPTAAFTATPTNGTSPLIVSFTDASTGSITNRLWNFGDGSTSSATSPTHVYTNSGPASFTATLTVRGLGGSNTASRVITVTGLDKTSAVGDWEVTISGADKGIAFLSFSNNATASGYGIRLKTFGLDTVSGTWSNGAKGQLAGSFLEQLGSATNWTGALVGKAGTDKSLSASIITNGSTKAGYKWKGIPATDFPNLSGTWSGQVTIAKTSSNVMYAITANATNAVFNIAKTTTNTVIGQFIATSKDAVAGFITISTNQTTFSGKFSEKVSKTGTNDIISLKGSVLNGGDTAGLTLIKQ